MLNKVIKTNPYILQSFEFDKKLLKIPLKECGEELISLKQLFKKAAVKVFFNERPLIKGETKIFYARKTVANALVKAVIKIRQKGFILKIEDAYRSLGNQKNKFLLRVKEIKQEFPEISVGEACKVANIYTAGIPLLAAHTAGAAVDAVLLDSNLNEVDMGCPYAKAGKEAAIDYNKVPGEIKKLRKLLCSIMESEGFTNYPFEYWHFSQGDVCAAHLKSEKQAIYSPIEFNPKIKKFKALPSKDCYRFF